MSYNIFNRTAPVMPKPSKGTEFCKFLLSQASKDMREPLVPMLFPVLGAHISGAEFQYPDRSWKETCGMMANLVAETTAYKGPDNGVGTSKQRRCFTGRSFHSQRWRGLKIRLQVS